MELLEIVKLETRERATEWVRWMELAGANGDDFDWRIQVEKRLKDDLDGLISEFVGSWVQRFDCGEPIVFEVTYMDEYTYIGEGMHSILIGGRISDLTIDIYEKDGRYFTEATYLDYG